MVWDLQQSSEFANAVSSGTVNVTEMLHSKQSIYSPELSALLSSCFFSGFVRRTDLLWLMANCLVSVDTETSVYLAEFTLANLFHTHI